jgi:signal transduction histidine kinase
VDTPSPSKTRFSFLTRGESVVATSGLGAAALILAAIGASGWWTLHANEDTRREGREQTLRAAAAFLGAAGEQMIAGGDLSQIRTLIAGAAGEHHFQFVRISLPEPDSLVIADSTPSEGSRYPALPATWTDRKAPTGENVLEHTRDGRARIVSTLNIPGKGPAVLEIEDAVPTTMWSDWRTQTGLGAIGAAALVAMAGFYRSVRTRFRSLGAISESLTALQAGETDSGVLTVAKSFGPEAEAWNNMLAERDEMRGKLSRTGAEQKLGDRRNRDGDLFSLCDAMWQGLLLIDEQMKVKFVNGAGAAFLRCKREDMIGKSASAFLTDPKVSEALKATAGGSGRGRTVIEVEGDKDASPDAKAATVLRFSIRPVRKEDNAAAVVVIEDVTQQRVADEARHSFVASATHELRTPLTNMRLYIDSLLEEPDQDVLKRTQAVNVVSQEAKRLERMVGDMLSVAQIESGTIKLNKGDVRLEPIFEDLKNDFAEQARQKEIKLRFDLPPKWPQMEGDRDKIVMALHNLIGNAIKYTPTGGEVMVRANADGKSFACDVTDNGIGIKEEEQPLIFEKFYRAKDKRIANVTGTGLGLSIAREVVRLHGGDISLKSAIDKGSTFTMTLPAKAA